MASDVMSLFGLDPNIIQQQRMQSGIDQAARMSADYAVGAAGGGMLGAGINSAFGLQTPEMQQAAAVQGGMAGADLNTPAGIRAAASQMMQAGQYGQAIALHNQARELENELLEQSQTKEDRARGEVSQVVVQSADASNPMSKDVKHTVIRYRDGRVTDATMGRTFENEADWIEALGGSPDVLVDTRMTPAEVLGTAKTEGSKAAALVKLDKNIELFQAAVDGLPEWVDYKEEPHIVTKLRELKEQRAELTSGE